MFSTILQCQRFILASMLTSKIKWNPLHLKIVHFGVKSDGSDMQGEEWVKVVGFWFPVRWEVERDGFNFNGKQAEM